MTATIFYITAPNGSRCWAINAGAGNFEAFNGKKWESFPARMCRVGISRRVDWIVYKFKDGHTLHFWFFNLNRRVFDLSCVFGKNYRKLRDELKARGEECILTHF